MHSLLEQPVQTLIFPVWFCLFVFCYGKSCKVVCLFYVVIVASLVLVCKKMYLSKDYLINEFSTKHCRFWLQNRFIMFKDLCTAQQTRSSNIKSAF